MFAKDKVSQSMIDAVNSVINEGKVDESSEKVPTSTGMKVYGSSYGNSAKAHRDQTKHSVDDVKEPTKKDIEKDSKLYQKGYHGTSKHYLRKDTQDYFAKTGRNEEVKMKEELKGNQHKIDANHNNKIDGQDFKILKAKKKVSEESEKEEGHEDAKQDKAMIKKMVKKDEGDCVTKPEAKTIAKKEVGGHEKRMHKENVFYRFAKQLQEDKSKGTEPTFTDNNMGEETPKKNQDIADKAYLKHKPGTVKGQLTQVSRFLRGKPEIKEDAEQIEEKEGYGGSDPLANREKYAKQHGTGQVYKKTYPGDKVGMTKSHAYDIKRTGPKSKLPEEVDESVQTQPSKSADKITTDTLSGRMPGGKLNSFKNYKVDLTTSGVEAVPKEFDNGVDTKEKQKITTSPGPIDIKMDDKLAKKSTQKEEVEQIDEVSLKTATSAYVKRAGEDDSTSQQKAVKTISHIANRYGVKGVARAAKIADLEYGLNDPVHNKRKDFVKGVMSGVKTEEVEAVEEKVIAGMSGFKKIKGADEKGNVTDKSGAVHTPMSRAKNAAKLTFSKLKQEMLGKISN